VKSVRSCADQICLDIRTSLLIANTSWESLPDGSTVVPGILGSDKTMLSTLIGDETALLVDPSMGNLSKVNRRSFKKKGLILLGLLPKCTNRSNTHNNRCTHHESIGAILHPLEEPAKSASVVMRVDSCTGYAFPRIASFLAEFPEQCSLTMVKNGWCPRCEICLNDMPRFAHRPWRCHPQ
jgi:hypothetical protein